MKQPGTPVRNPNPVKKDNSSSDKMKLSEMMHEMSKDSA
jgi:hypothetical protein